MSKIQQLLVYLLLFTF